MEPPPEPEPEPQSLSEASAPAPLRAPEVARLREEQEKVVTNCQEKIQHWEKVDSDYSALQERLRTLPDKLSYDVMAAGDIVDIREEIKSDFEFKGKQRIAHKPHSKPKTSNIFEADFENEVKSKDLLADEELWARLEELERQEELLGELDSNEEDEDDDEDDDDVDDDDDDNYNENESDHTISADNSVPTIYFSHTVEPKRVRINTGKNTTLKFSEKKEEAKRKRKSSSGSHATHELPAIRSPADIYRVFVDVVNGEYVPRKSILKSRSRENSVCSDTSESSAADVDDRRAVLRSVSWEEAPGTDASASISEEPQENHPKKLLPSGVSEAFSGTVIEKEFSSPSLTPHSAIAHHALPTIPERKEVLSEASEEPAKRVSKFKAARLQQRN
ncbi:Unconventional prefoldin RPB5 interactor [Microtus ochrogaster]|uniref:Unconventional prefoldin RPB5 interactor n=1 Tax=Microtus ochrogaster TaxID=79684 RepID=A0A8J6GYS4_MICOH|nr:Unconventional prefoldin RPB5 interactor [Microtus ochrogaster]